MTIRKVTTKVSKSQLPVLINNKNQVVMEVFLYMRYLLINNYSKNTIKNYCYHLKTYYEWLDYVGLDYHSAVAKKSENNKGIVENLTAFKLWLKYGAMDKIIPIDGYKQIREAKTINTIFDVVLTFYDYLALQEDVEPLNVYKTYRGNSSFSGFLNEMVIKHETTYQTNLFKEKVTKKGLKYITREEYEKCYQSTNCLRDKVIIGLMFECGLRISETIGLTIEDFKNIMDRKITIVNHHDTYNVDSALKYESAGTVFVTPRLQQDIIQYINEVLTKSDNNYFIINLYGKTKNQPMRRRNIEQIIKRLGKKVGIPDLHPHMFRHGLAVDMLSNGCSMVQIKDTLRHKNISTTMDIYAEYNQTAKRKLMDEYHEKIETTLMPDDIDIDAFVDMILEEDEQENYDYEE